ncbi:MAG: right-handed parallel beta-helix repeat-containing protein [Verrucomicrobia bacterium]|nr:right-handed parallel beta-helix repeat-containing protein [Verrucomicrobiota bacterium]
MPKPPSEFHVCALKGDDSNAGTSEKPFLTIMAAARVAQPGDTITVHAGVYRERVNPPCGGESDARRIVYQAAPGERVEIKGSEIVTGWTKAGRDVWSASVPDAFFHGFNPFADPLCGDWFFAKGGVHHSGAVYINGVELPQSTSWAAAMVYHPCSQNLWHAEVQDGVTTIWVRCPGVNPNEALVEVNARRTVFYPDKPGIDFLTVRGFVMSQAATPWAPPTAEQIGLIGTNWSKGWIIENNEVSHSRCTGIALGKYGDEFDNKAADTAEGYIETIQRAWAADWKKENVGHHIVRKNHIHHCEQAGIVGSLGAIFSEVTDNLIHDIHQQKNFDGAEQGGIKFHGAVDVLIARNQIFRAHTGIWLDWMTQGTRVTCNLLHENREDLSLEVNHGPFVVDHNIFLSKLNLIDRSQGGAYVHNLFAGRIWAFHSPKEGRLTPWLRPHSTELGGMNGLPFGDDRFINNILFDLEDLESYREAPLPVLLEGNVSLKGTPGLSDGKEGRHLHFHYDAGASGSLDLITTERLGRAAIPGLPFESADGQPVRFDTDYFGRPRGSSRVAPGPFAEQTTLGEISLRIWPLPA